MFLKENLQQAPTSLTHTRNKVALRLIIRMLHYCIQLNFKLLKLKLFLKSLNIQ